MRRLSGDSIPINNVRLRFLGSWFNGGLPLLAVSLTAAIVASVSCFGELELGKLQSHRAVDLLRPASSHPSFYVGSLAVENFQPFAIADLSSFSVRFPRFGDN